MPNPEKQTVLILGASGDIGSCLARLLAAAGHPLVLASRASDRLDAVAAELDARKIEVDATSVEAVNACFEAAADEFGSLAGAANCVGSVLLKPAHLTDESQWSDTLATNLTSAFATVRAAAKTMKQGGSVVLFSSAAARTGLANHEAIAAAKAGVEGLTLAASATYASRGLRFNAIAPGLVKTKLTKQFWGSEKAAEISKAMHPLGRLGEPRDVASLAAWLLDPVNSWVTGEVFSVDGGLARLQATKQ